MAQLDETLACFDANGDKGQGSRSPRTSPGRLIACTCATGCPSSPATASGATGTARGNRRAGAVKRRGEYVGNNQGKHTAPRALRGYRVMRRDGVCFACTCVVDVVRTTRRSAFLFVATRPPPRASPLSRAVRTRASAALDFLGAGLRHIPLAGQRADGEGGSGGVGSSNEGGGREAVVRLTVARALRGLGPVDHAAGSGVAQTQHLALPGPVGGLPSCSTQSNWVCPPPGELQLQELGVNKQAAVPPVASAQALSQSPLPVPQLRVVHPTS